MGEGKKRGIRIKSPKYREYIGQRLRNKRQELGYSLSDIYDMSGIPPNTTLNTEKGITTNIDYYVEYAKTVKYQLDDLNTAGIEAVPSEELSKEKRERTFLTLKIRKSIIEPDFLGEGKTTEQIIEELIKLKLLTTDQVSSTEVAGVMQNFIKDETVKVVGKTGNKNIYSLKQKEV